ncbi:MAG TPA: sigma-70 family RNA polymerase sigma factor, partial [Solirubrobacteraceae bacterium]|nr:sigma-70 family RNA polymerase sigma factor [Solirubrobacteraceae bacterium]
AQRGTSLDATLDCDDATRSLGDLVGTVDPGYARSEERVLVSQLARGLSTRDQEILRLRFEEDMTQSEIGAMFGVSQMQVSRLIRSAIERLRAVAEHDERMAAA